MNAEKANADRELDRLIDRMCDQIASVDELAALGHRLADDPTARDYYIACLELHARLAWQMTPGRPFSPEELLRYAGEDEGRGARGQRRGMAGSPAIDGEAGSGVRGSGFEVRDSEPLSVGAAVELPQQLDPEPRTPNPEPPFPTLSTTHYPLPTSDFVGSWAFSYMVATVIMGMAILGFWAYKITHHQHIAEAPSQSVPSEAMPEMVFVGRITGMVDVKWSDDPRYLPPPGFAHVPLGRKYILSSGLLEITYDSGAKVILEGPCTYEVESTAGGYLSLGKLTARVGEDKEARRQGDKEKKADAVSSYLLVSPSPGLPAFSLFSVRTPTAVVTDLGTEFGVEVAENGGCEVHLIQGKVLARRIGSAGMPIDGVELSSSEDAVRFDPDRSGPVFISPAPERFLLMWAGLKRKRISRWPIGDKTMVAWVSLANLTQQGGGVISIENYWTNGFDGIDFAELAPRKWMAASNSYLRTQRDQSQYPDETAGPEQFVQIAIVYDQTQITIYRDGKVYAEYKTDSQQTFSNSSVVLMGKRCMERPWRIPPHYTPTLAGKIEEARLYDVALSSEVIAALKPNESSPIDPVGQWTFEDGTARDSMGCFSPGELRGAARIADGKLILDGADSYLLMPSRLKRDANPSAEADAPGQPVGKKEKEGRRQIHRKETI